MSLSCQVPVGCRQAACSRARRQVMVKAQVTIKSLRTPPKAPTVNKLEFSKPLEIIKYPDPRLRAMNAKIGVFDESLKELASEMIKIMYQDDGVGLAAPQVGVNVRLMVFNPDGRTKPGNEQILVNPEVLGITANVSRGEEGCLSFPKIYGDVDRPREIRIRAQDETGKPVEMTLTGWTGRVFQHEYDHLQGILFCDRMSSTVVDTVRPQVVAMEEAYLQQHPGAQVQRLPPPAPPKPVGFGAGPAKAKAK